jgi:hypothetical protein
MGISGLRIFCLSYCPEIVGAGLARPAAASQQARIELASFPAFTGTPYPK